MRLWSFRGEHRDPSDMMTGRQWKATFNEGVRYSDGDHGTHFPAAGGYDRPLTWLWRCVKAEQAQPRLNGKMAATSGVPSSRRLPTVRECKHRYREQVVAFLPTPGSIHFGRPATASAPVATSSVSKSLRALRYWTAEASADQRIWPT